MAHTAHPKERIQETFDNDICIAKKAKLTAQLIQECKHLTFFTGAGMSTSSGIPDYRGPEVCTTMPLLMMNREFGQLGSMEVRGGAQLQIL
jgi:hypothetical protein